MRTMLRESALEADSGRITLAALETRNCVSIGLAFLSDALPTEPSLPLTAREEEQKNKKKKNKNQMSKNKKKNSNKKTKPGKTKGWETKTSLLTQCSRFL